MAVNPRLGDWLRVLRSGVVEVRPGKVELGQGVLTALSQVAAEELDVGVARVRMIPAATGASPDEGYTAGSLPIQHSGSAIRLVCAEARGLYLGVAATRLGVPESKLTVADGQILAPDGRSTSYWELADDALLDRAASGEYQPKPASAYHVVGTSVPRLDLPDKLTGRRFVHDLSPDGLCYGRIVRPPSRGATLTGLDTTATLALPGVLTVVRDGSFLGVVAEEEEVALGAADRLRADATWARHPTLPDPGGLPAFLRSAAAETTVLAERAARPARQEVAASFEATYHRPYLAHASMGPSSATALFGGKDGQADSHSGVVAHPGHLPAAGRTRPRAWPRRRRRYGHARGGGWLLRSQRRRRRRYGRRPARHGRAGRPVQVVWSRADELTWAPFGAAAVVRVAADVDAAGNVLSWQHEIWGNGHSTRPGSTRSVALLANSHRAGGEEIEAAAEPPMARGGGAGRNSVPDYDFPAYRAVNHRLLDMPLRTSALRSLGAFLNVFAAESFMDELAFAAGRDPVAYRLACLSDPRARAVIESAARRSGWDNWSPAESAGLGIGFARYKNTSAYCAVVAEVEAVSEVRVRRLTIAVNARPGDQPGRCCEPGRGRRGPGHQLGAEGAGALRPVRCDQRYLGDISYSAVLRGAGGRRGVAAWERKAGCSASGDGAGSHGGGHRQRRLRRTGGAGAHAAVHRGEHRGGHAGLTGRGPAPAARRSARRRPGRAGGVGGQGAAFLLGAASPGSGGPGAVDAGDQRPWQASAPAVFSDELLMMIIRSAQVPVGATTGSRASDGVPDDCPLRAQAGEAFAGEVAAGRVLRCARSDSSAGHVRLSALTYCTTMTTCPSGLSATWPVRGRAAGAGHLLRRLMHRALATSPAGGAGGGALRSIAAGRTAATSASNVKSSRHSFFIRRRAAEAVRSCTRARAPSTWR